ncbi:MAG: hypothetical protein HXS54_11990 [Theionarchaea archaeon]|nr:hypothetical protein [Theionarchaea archaeon]
MIRPERVRYIGTLFSMGVNMVSKEVGKIITDSISEKIGKEMGEKVGGYLGGEIVRSCLLILDMIFAILMEKYVSLS